jgi:hypothetical protein
MDERMDGWMDVDKVHFAQDMDQWRTPVNTAMNFPVP